MKTVTGRSLIRISLNIIFYCIVFVSIGYACLWCYHFVYLAFSNPVYQEEPAVDCVIEIAEGEKPYNVMLKLQENGIIENGYAAYLRLYCSRYEGSVKPGQYELSSNMHLDDVLAILAQDVERDQKEESSELSKQYNASRKE